MRDPFFADVIFGTEESCPSIANITNARRGVIAVKEPLAVSDDTYISPFPFFEGTRSSSFLGAFAEALIEVVFLKPRRR